MADEHFFFVNPSAVDGEHFTLDETESHHFSIVLRRKKGDSIWLLDGEGTGYEGKVDDISTLVSGTITRVHPRFGEPQRALHLTFGILKKDGLEWMLEKGTEVGVKSFQPLMLERCVKKSINLERCQKIVTAAAKQCGRSMFPKVHEPMSLDDWLGIYQPDYRGVLHWTGFQGISGFAIDYHEGPIHVLIGPEGDFTDKELDMISDADVSLVKMGERRLRSETAAVTAASFMIHFDLGCIAVGKP